MCVSPANYLGLDNLYASSLEETDSPSLSQRLPPVALHLVVGPSGIFPAHAGMSAGVIMLVLVRVHGCSFPLIYRRYCLRVRIFPWFSLTLGAEVVLKMCPLGWVHTVTVSLHFDESWISIVVSATSNKLLRWLMGESYFCLWVRGQAAQLQLENGTNSISFQVCHFSSHGSWLCLQSQSWFPSY